MNRTHLITLLSAVTMSCATLQSATAAPMTQRPPVLKSPIFKGGRTLPQAEQRLFGTPIPLMTDALNYAKIGRVGNNGARTAIYATVLLAGSGMQSVAGRQQVTYANGVMRLEGKNRDRLAGDLALYDNTGSDNAGTDNPFRQNVGGSLHLVVYADGTAFLTVKSPPHNGVSLVKKATFKPTGTTGMLWGSARFSRTQDTLVSIGLNKVVDPLENTVVAPPVVQPAAPRGMKVRVGGEIRITNSDDGVADGDVEMFGNVSFNGQEMWKIKRSSAQDGKKGDVILLDYITCNVLFDDPSTWILKVGGSLYDRDMDKGEILIQGDDDMWNPPTGKYSNKYKIYEIDLKKMVEQQNKQTTLYGDRSSENADVKIKVMKLGDIN